MSNSHRTLIAGGDVLVGDPLRADVRRADILVEDGTIVAIGNDLAGTDAEIVPAEGRWVLPGFVDTHRHLWQTTMRALTANWNLNDYFCSIRSTHAGLHGADDVYAGQYAGALDALSAGVTTTIDHSHCINSPDHADEAVRGVKDAGIRALWCYGFYASPMDEPVFTTPEQRLADARRIRDTHFSSNDGLVRMGVALNELGFLPFHQTRAEIELADELDVRVTAHTQCVWNTERVSDVALLQRAGLLRAGQVHSHCNTCTDEELAVLRDAGCSVSSTPDTELQMGCGIPIYRRAAALGLTAGVGVDIVSNNSGDFFTPMRILMQHERGHALQPVLEARGLKAVGGDLPVTTRQILHAATLAGARALGLESVCGSIEIGKSADLLLLRNDGLHMRPVIDPIDSIVLQAGTRDIDRVLVAGRTVVRDGRLPGDVERSGTRLIEEAHERLAERVAARGGWKQPVPDGLWDEMWPVMLANLAADRAEV
ncbi:amidohydrolase family protein [Rhodococcus opacus]|uniref:Amidohydrolase family protein n=1 Tax=Rhodococcus opacus TaxID=37919 RepID=A0AAX3YR96_RHOOP|nr:amidohydrolase family protein [Rhodococcus opacus]MCZ4587619.1 amidohydrolase family protein [Rhodococcus opacus]WLF51385.1 amidohydrolase family protein [Rhodococcus opacus]